MTIFERERTNSAADPEPERITTDVAVVVPTRNESGNVVELLSRLAGTLADRRAAVVLVDDSDDDTPEQVIAHRDDTDLDVVLRHRPPGERKGGLGGAVVDGLRLVDAKWIAVMDGDLQHPPEVVGEMLGVAEREQRDIVIASRYRPDGGADGLSSPSRALASHLAGGLAHVLFPRRLRGVTDPMTGMFLMRGDAVDPDELRPRGFKILLEILGRCPALSRAEVPLAFQPRHWGRSKASLHEGLRFLVHLLTLRLATLTPVPLRSGRLGRAVLFGAVGLTGLIVNAIAFVLLRDAWAGHYVAAAIGATQISTLWNFALLEALVFNERKSGLWPARLAKFAAFNNLSLLLRVPLLVVLVRAGARSEVANVITLVLLFVVRFVFADRLIYAVREAGGGSPVRIVDAEARPAATTSGLRARDAYLPHRYSIHGILTIGSEVALPELEYFRASWIVRDFDVEIRRGPVGRAWPRMRTVLTRHGTTGGVTYEEHLGRLGANFRVEMGAPIRVTVGPLLHHSPHVLYTNVVEALLRFLLVSKGRMLLHSACLRLDDRGVLVSARTDTGKTGTVLRLVRDKGALFLSDDMTILEPDGLALCYPKPLTISSHTLQALDVSELGRRESVWLRVQSRLHSKGGRRIGALLGRLNLPIMSVNAITQMLVQPPKYAVERLVLADLTRCTPVDHAFVIERGETAHAAVGQDELLEELIANTDDAYGFPPFASFAPSIVIGGARYAELRDREREILRSAIAHVPARRLATPDFSWADAIPAAIEDAAGAHSVTVLRNGVPAQRQRRPDRRTGVDRRRPGMVVPGMVVPGMVAEAPGAP
ncbi:MAG: glycosyltransferase [Frankiaceae bacterium]